MANGLVDSYLRGEARAFFGPHFRDPEDRRRAVARAQRPLAPRVLEVLASQNGKLPPSASRDAQLEALRRGAVAVVTGQQVGLFLGPLFTLYKAASAIRVAHALTAETGHPAVPIFWLQTEDHDLPEIAQCCIPGTADVAHALCVPSSPTDRISIAHRPLPDEVAACLRELGEAFGNRPHGEAHLARLARHYRPGAGWSEAFAGVLAELFADEGLLFLDPRDAALAAAAAPIHERALVDAAGLSEAMGRRVQELEQAGFTAPIHIRPGAPLSFFHPAGREGPRFRLEAEGAAFREVGGEGRHTEAELLAALRGDPLTFSTSALLRPILQDALLPTAAYVGGPGEVAYFAQLAPLYEAFGLPMPLVVPRARFRLLEEKSVRLLERHGLAANDAALSENELLAKCQGAGRDAVTRALLAPFEAGLEALAPELARLDQGLPRAAEKTRLHVTRSIARLARKHEKALLYRDAALVADIRKLRLLLNPNGAPQERVYGLPYFAARRGDRELVEAVLAAIEPFEPSLKDLPL